MSDITILIVKIHEERLYIKVEFQKEYFGMSFDLTIYNKWQIRTIDFASYQSTEPLGIEALYYHLEQRAKLSDEKIKFYRNYLNLQANEILNHPKVRIKAIVN